MISFCQHLQFLLQEFNQLFPNASCIKVYMGEEENYELEKNFVSLLYLGPAVYFHMSMPDLLIESFEIGRDRLAHVRLDNVTRLDLNANFDRDYGTYLF